ncbi:THAP domain-containing protein 9 [Elysia marginata]|uniref:THAP domain-containing protein 9 n=1 Tax=Elysia marginata TaxID=1093978 RepID=A0AAV4GFN0_9GAST|nr:THAP domain-containing protein 9 [Elysia marginata]
MLLNHGVYHGHVLHYIAGFICRRLKEKIVCSDCCAFLSRSNRALADSTLTHKKNRGGLIFVSYDFRQVVQAADRSLRRLLTTAKGGPLSSVSSMTTRLVTLEVTETLRTKVFIGLNQHSADHHRIARSISPDYVYSGLSNVKYIKI